MARELPEALHSRPAAGPELAQQGYNDGEQTKTYAIDGKWIELAPLQVSQQEPNADVAGDRSRHEPKDQHSKLGHRIGRGKEIRQLEEAGSHDDGRR